MSEFDIGNFEALLDIILITRLNFLAHRPRLSIELPKVRNEISFRNLWGNEGIRMEKVLRNLTP